MPAPGPGALGTPGLRPLLRGACGPEVGAQRPSRTASAPAPISLKSKLRAYNCWDCSAVLIRSRHQGPRPRCPAPAAGLRSPEAGFRHRARRRWYPATPPASRARAPPRPTPRRDRAGEAGRSRALPSSLGARGTGLLTAADVCAGERGTRRETISAGTAKGAEGAQGPAADRAEDRRILDATRPRATANYCSFDTKNSIDHGFRWRANSNYWLLCCQLELRLGTFHKAVTAHRVLCSRKCRGAFLTGAHWTRVEICFLFCGPAKGQPLWNETAHSFASQNLSSNFFSALAMVGNEMMQTDCSSILWSPLPQHRHLEKSFTPPRLKKKV
ncbi:uncharacterized protein LOC101700585 [Heterocephalus glaber]|uniref:Uncharacterized protein LOC101700585 n=1 Tax=Heterocephalus glaber TaxID=10181 RepID=A0AAX6NSB9_HETGA|nr:uncharacterized protein LOC101700585 [Heterocephalus glaber]